LANPAPKPNMDFEFKQHMPGEPVTITSGVLYECEQSDCSDALLFVSDDIQEFFCEANSCHAYVYHVGPYYRLEIQFSDGQIRRSNVFKKTSLKSYYVVSIRLEDLLVKAQFRLDALPPTVTYLLGALVGAALIIGTVVFRVHSFKKK
jgi:hypothetical protein